MRKAGVAAFYALIAALGIFLFISIRWAVINNSPVFYEKTSRKVMTPQQVVESGIEFDSDKQYYQVEKKRIYLKAAKYPKITKETTTKTEVDIQPSETAAKESYSGDGN